MGLAVAQLTDWECLDERQMEIFRVTFGMFFQRQARERGKFPDAVYVIRGVNGDIVRSAMLYVEPGRWDRWGIQQHPADDIEESWSTVLSWLRPLIGDRAAIEVYPRECEIINTVPKRWFWVVPFDTIPFEWNLCEKPATW